MSFKERRKALGLNRKELAYKAYSDPPSIQLLELGHHVDPVVQDRIERTLTALEAGESPPNWKAAVDEAIANDPESADFRNRA